MYLAALAQLCFTDGPKRPALMAHDVPFSNMENKRLHLRHIIDTTKVPDYGRFKTEILDPLPTTTYEEWCAYKPSVVPTYTRYISDGSVTLTEIQKEHLLNAIVQKVIWLLDRYKDFVRSNPTVHVVRPGRETEMEAIAYVKQGKNTVYINSAYVYDYSDERIFDVMLHEIAHIIHANWHIRLRTARSMFGGIDLYNPHGVYWQLIHQKMGGSGIDEASNEWFRYHVPKQFIEDNPYVYFMCVDAEGRKGGCYKGEQIPVDDGSINFYDFKRMLTNTDVTLDGRLVCQEDGCDLHPGNRYQVIIPDWFRNQCRHGKEVANEYKKYVLDIPSLEDDSVIV